MEFDPRVVPYRFRPPFKDSWRRRFFTWLSGKFYLRRKFAVASVTSTGEEQVTALLAAGEGVMLAGNHADHADPHVMLQISARARWKPRFMAAREGFESGKLASYALQSTGAFSIDRDGADLSALKTAIETVASGEHPLVIFPEGEIYHHQESLDPIHDGFASILLKASSRMPDGKKAWLVPMALTYRYPPEIEKTWDDRIGTLEYHTRGQTFPGRDPVDRLLSLGEFALENHEPLYLGSPHPGDPLPARLTRLREKILSDVESRLGLSFPGKSTPERFRSVRGHLRRKLLSDPPLPPSERPALHEEFVHLHRVHQLYSYPGTYLTENPTRERVSETILKLEEDILDSPRYSVRRTAHVTFDTPVDAPSALAAAGGQPKAAAAELTRHLTANLTRLLRPT
ncbi:MAG: lysophospholipid acyltransferase family protein [Verrucomicrobiales bacterium]